MGAHTNAALRAELGNCLRGLSGALEAFAAHVRSRALGVWAWRPADADAVPRIVLPDLARGEQLEVVARALLAIQYTEGQRAHESRIAPGLVVLPNSGVGLAEEINVWKERLAAALKAMEGREETGVLDARTGERGSRPLREVALEAFYFGRLHYFQAVRKLVVLRESAASVGTPEYVSFGWASCRSVRRTSRDALIEELSKRLEGGRDSPRLLRRDLAALGRLAPGEPLAVVREAPPTVKANVAWAARDGGAPTRRIVSAVAPLVMLGTALPARFRPLPPKPPSPDARLARRDTELEPQALLATVPAFRYLRRYRAAKRATTSAAGS